MTHGQSICLVQTPDGYAHPVTGAVGVIPEGLVDGKLKEINPPYNVIMKGTVSYADGFIKFDDFRVDPVFDDNGTPDDKNFSLKGVLTSDRTLRNNYLLFEFEADPGNPATIVIAEAPDLTAGVATTLRLNVPQDPTLRLQERNYNVHFYSGTHEHVTSLMSAADQASAQAHTDAEILKNTANRRLKIVLRVAPDWPANIPITQEGSATIQARVGTEGIVLQASVAEATSPEFGANALEAVKQCVFAPAIRNHEYVEQVVKIPVLFTKPKPKAAAPAAAPASPAAK